MTTPNKDIDDWKALPWKKFQKVVFRLQTRIYKARKNGNHKLVNTLQKLLLHSKAAKYLAVRQVTQLNQGKATAGVDGKTALNLKERLQLVGKLASGWKTWEHRKLRRVLIPKKDGTQRKLGIPTIADRAYQCLLKYALEPAAEATFHGNSYGFRPGRSTHDVQKRLFTSLRSKSGGISKTILEMDIEKCFDKIDHQALLEKVELPRITLKGLRLALKAGVRGEFPASTEGTPQGGVISPLLANIALNGIESVLDEINPRTSNKKANRVTCLRYADDLVYIFKDTLSPNSNLIKTCRLKIDKFLKQRGLRVKESKTRVVAATEGFDFLGWNFKVKANGKFISTPTKETTDKVKAKIKETMKDSSFNLEERIKKCGSIVRGWRNYNQFCDMRRHTLWSSRLWTWKFIRKQGSYDRRETNNAINKALPPIPWHVNTHINVKGDKSPFDNDFIYWGKRSSNKYSGTSASILKRQNFKCQACGLTFLSDDNIELHHKDGNHDNWKMSNLEMLHRHCHQHTPVHVMTRLTKKVRQSVINNLSKAKLTKIINESKLKVRPSMKAKPPIARKSATKASAARKPGEEPSE